MDKSLILILVVGLLFSICDGGILKKDNSTSDERNNVRCSGTVPMIGSVPHFLYCDKFFICVPAPSGSINPTMPQEMSCPMGRDGPLNYDFRNCTCQYDATVCFNAITDNAEFFTCAKEYDPDNPQSIQLPVLPPDHE